MEAASVDQLARALDDTALLVAGVGEHQWDRPTPCAQWDVRHLVEHMVVGHQVFARALSGQAVSAVPTPTPSEPSALPAAFAASAAAMLEAFRAPGALEGAVRIPVGTVPAMVALHLRIVEALVQGWDVARATGQAFRHDDGLARQELGFSRAFLSQVPAGRTPFAPSLSAADDAPPLDRLAALLGRDLAWTAGSPGR